MTAEELFNQGAEFLDQKKWDEAIEAFTRAIELKPDFVKAYNNRGFAYTEKGEYDRAIEDLNKAIELDPSDAYAYTNRGVAYSKKGEHDRALEDYNKAIELDPNDANAYSNRGNAYSEKGEYDRAIEDHNKAIEFKPDDAEIYSNRGVAYQGKGEYDRAIKDYNKAIELEPDDAEVYSNRGNAYADKGEYDRAIEDHDKAIELDPNDAKAYYNRGNAYVNKEEYDRALEDYNKAIELKPDFAKAYNNRGLAYKEKEEYDRAIEDYNKALEIDPDHKGAIHNRAVALAFKISGRVGNSGDEYRKIAGEYREKEESLDRSIRHSVGWLVASLGVLSTILVIGLFADPIKWLVWIFCDGLEFCEVIAGDYGVAPCGDFYQDTETCRKTQETSNGLTPFAFLPWILLMGLVLSPLAWRIRYLRDEKLHNELLKHSYERKAYLEARWTALPQDKTANMAVQLMEHWMEKGPEEAILALNRKGDSGTSPLTPAALAAMMAAVRRVDKS